MRQRLLRAAKLATLGVILAVVTLTLPDSSPRSTEIALVKVHEASAADINRHVISILAVGSDARPGEDFTHTRGDALQLVTINTQTHAASIIGVPRDSWVDIPGHGHDKINASLYYGGPALMGRAVGNLIGVQPTYVFVTRFQYLTQMVHWLGGIDVRNPTRSATPRSSPRGSGPVASTSAGTTPWRTPGSGTPCPAGTSTGPPTRRSCSRRSRPRCAPTPTGPGFIERGVLDAMSHLYTNLPPTELFRLAQVMAQVDPSKVRRASCRAASGRRRAGRASCCPTSPRPATWATRSARTGPSRTAADRTAADRHCG